MLRRLPQDTGVTHRLDFVGLDAGEVNVVQDGAVLVVGDDEVLGGLEVRQAVIKVISIV